MSENIKFEELQGGKGTPSISSQVTEQVLLQMKKIIEFCKNKVIDREFKTEEFLKNL